MTFGRKKSNAMKQKGRASGKAPGKNDDSTRKGRGKRAKETIRETPRKTEQQKTRNHDAGPPLKISGGASSKAAAKQITPAEVVRNIRTRK